MGELAGRRTAGRLDGKVREGRKEGGRPPAVEARPLRAPAASRATMSACRDISFCCFSQATHCCASRSVFCATYAV